MLENKYGEYEALENQRILMERMNVETQEEIDAIIKKDMEDFVAYTDAKMDESIDNYYEFYTSFESWFDDFFASYTKNLQQLGKLNREFLDMLDIEDYLDGNGMDVEGGLGTLGTLSAEDKANLYKRVNLGTDYSLKMEEAIRDGDYEAAQEYALLREAKADMQGITLGQGNYRTNQQVWDDAMAKYGKTVSTEINNQLSLNQNSIDKNAQYTLNNGNTLNKGNALIQGQTTQLSSGLTDVQKEIISQAGYTVDAINALANTLSVSMEAIVSSIEAGGNGWVDGTGMSNAELEDALANGQYVDLGGGVYLDPNKKAPVYNSVDEDPGVIGSQAWIEMAKKDGWTDEQIEATMADVVAQNIERELVHSISDMKRNTDLAGMDVTIGSSTVSYNEDGYAYRKVSNNASVSDDGQIVYTSRDGTQRQVTDLSHIVNTDMISSNIKTVASAMREAGYSIDSIGGVIASQIAASSKEEISRADAEALASQMQVSGISNAVSSLLTTSNANAQLISNIGTSVQSAIEYLGSIDSNTAASINDSYSYKGSSGGGSDHSGKVVNGKYYSGMSAQGGANTDYSKADNSNSSTGTYDKYTDYSAAYQNASSDSERAAIEKARDEKVKNEYGGVDPNPNWKGHADGIKTGPVTYTGLAMLHGTPQEPEYVLNNDQAYNLLYNLSAARDAKIAEFDRVKSTNSGTQYVVQGDIILEGVDDPAEFWQEVTNAMGNRWNVTKNR